MWPWDFFQRRRYQRAFDAALVVFLAAHMFDRMSSAERLQVDDEVDSILKRTTVPSAAHRRWATPDARALFRAIAMANLGIEPVLAGFTWKALMRHWPLLRIALFFDFHPYAQPTWDAEEFLREKNIEIPIEMRKREVAV